MNSEEDKKHTVDYNGIELKGIVSSGLTFEERMALIERFRDYMNRYFPGIMEEIVEDRDRKLQEDPNRTRYRD